MNSFSTISSILSRRKGIDTWLLMMLLACSTNLNAQSDPFGTVDVHKYSENMTLFGQVLLNGTPLGSETVIAAFHGDELRGKGSPSNMGRHTNIFFFQVYGEKSGEDIVFKVYTNGKTVEVNQNLKYITNSEVGSPNSYYYIDLPGAAPGAAVEQTFMLAKGWNWVSGFLQESISTSGLASGSKRIVSQTDELILDPVYGMTGGLTTLEPGLGYKVEATAAFACKYSGHVCQPTKPVSLEKGWNWIGYPVVNVLTPSVALAALNAEEGDCIIGQNGMAIFSGGEWAGTLDNLVPCHGYMFRSASKKQFCYSLNAAARSKASQPSTLNPQPSTKVSQLSTLNFQPYTPVDMHTYPNVMGVIARLCIDGEAGDWQVGAFCGDECRGTSKQVGEVLMMNVYGNGGEAITFRAINRLTGEEVELDGSETFRSDVVGTMQQPLLLSPLGTSTGIETILNAQGSRETYDLQGRRVNGSLKRGLYIVGGKKILVR